MFSMSDTGTPIQQYGGQMKDLDEAVQHICHIEQRNEKGDYYTFIAIDPFSSHIFGCPENLSYHTEPTVYLGNNED
jgi:hypothetical protein